MVNPLSKHFRQPQIYIRLPSQGQWYPPGSLEMPATKELAVYAMTAKDELTLLTPDALLNGQSTVDVIQSCIPAIKNAWEMPLVDLDAVLIAIRQATYGNEMEFKTACPHCNRENEHVADLGHISSKITCPDYNKTLKIDGLEFFLVPQNYYQFNKSSIENFDQQRIINVVNDETLSEEDRLSKFNTMFNKILDLTVEQVAKSVSAVKTEEGVTVEDDNLINDFFKNCDRKIWDAVKTELENISKQSPLKSINVVCEHEDCAKSYTTPLIFEQSNFFARGF